jgi:Rap1a immunity proteins
MSFLLAPLIAFSAATPTQSASPPLKGRAIYTLCSDHKDGSLGDSVCDAYIEGYIEGMDAAKVSGATGHAICIPNSVSGLQVRQTVERFFANNPDALSRDAPTMVAVALAKAYPC